MSVPAGTNLASRCMRLVPRLRRSVAPPHPEAAADAQGGLRGMPVSDIQEAGQGRGRRILLVDDEDGLCDLAARALEGRGWTVSTAASGEEALALAPQVGGIDVVVADLAMPGMDGLSLIRALRREQPRLPAILASGYAGETLAGDRLGDRLGLLAKPYTLRQLAAAIEAALEAKDTA